MQQRCRHTRCGILACSGGIGRRKQCAERCVYRYVTAQVGLLALSSWLLCTGYPAARLFDSVIYQNRPTTTGNPPPGRRRPPNNGGVVFWNGRKMDRFEQNSAHITETCRRSSSMQELRGITFLPPHRAQRVDPMLSAFQTVLLSSCVYTHYSTIFHVNPELKVWKVCNGLCSAIKV